MLSIVEQNKTEQLTKLGKLGLYYLDKFNQTGVFIRHKQGMQSSVAVGDHREGSLLLGFVFNPGIVLQPCSSVEHMPFLCAGTVWLLSYACLHPRSCCTVLHHIIPHQANSWCLSWRCYCQQPLFLAFPGGSDQLVEITLKKEPIFLV